MILVSMELGGKVPVESAVTADIDDYAKVIDLWYKHNRNTKGGRGNIMPGSYLWIAAQVGWTKSKVAGFLWRIKPQRLIREPSKPRIPKSCSVL